MFFCCKEVKYDARGKDQIGGNESGREIFV